jgi:uncharacterized protein
MAILEAVLESLRGDEPIKEARSNSTWIAVWSRYCGLASTLASAEYEEGGGASRGGEAHTGRSARQLAVHALSDDPLHAAMGMAAMNSLLDVDESHCEETNARDLLLRRAAGKCVVLVGHFPFVPELREVAQRLSVLELRPRAGDLPAAEAERAIPEADVLAITGTAFVNHTIEPLLSYRNPRALVVVLGPTAPLSPVLFDFGIDIISGARVSDPALVLRQVSEGASFRQMTGVRRLTIRRPGLKKRPFPRMPLFRRF